MKSAKSALKKVVEDLRTAESRSLARKYSESTRGIVGAAVFDGLTPSSLSLAAAHVSASSPPRVNLVLPELSLSALFAGIRTAIEFAAGLADRMGLELRLVHLQGRLSEPDRAKIRDITSADFNYDSRRVSFVGAEAIAEMLYSAADVWVGTHWTTAHALDVACQLNVINPEQVIYLVQDYEPGFYPWSSEQALAQSTYHAGFRLVVNSAPVARYLRERENIEVGHELIFRPSLDMPRLMAAAEQRWRRASGESVVTFYARPNKPRNLYRIGVAALQIAAQRLADTSSPTNIYTFGDLHAKPERGVASSMRVLGKLPWDRYFDHLATTDVLLSLQMSPHPSHPPLDAVVSGGIAVTNDLDGTRGHLHGRLRAVAPHPAALADAIVAAVEEARQSMPVQAFDPSVIEEMGHEIGSVLDAVVRRGADD